MLKHYNDHMKISARRCRILCGSVAAVSCLPLSGNIHAEAADARISVFSSQVTNHITPDMFGSCIEDVNHEIYGGLYDQRIFGESFEEPTPAGAIAGWIAYGGDWRVEADSVVVKAGSGPKLVCDAPDFDNGSIEAGIRFSSASGENAGILVRVRNAAVGADTFDGYEISLSPSRQMLILGKHRHDWHSLQEAPVTVKTGDRNNLRVVLDGSRIRIFVNGSTTPSIDFTDSEQPFLSGKIALRTWNSDATFQDVNITAGQKIITTPFRALPAAAVSGQWKPIDTEGSVVTFTHDSDRPFNGKYSQQVRYESGKGHGGVVNGGLNNWGIAVKKGQVFQGRIHLRASDLQGPVTVALQSADGRTTYASKAFSGVESDWTKYPLTFKSNATDANARFAVWLDRPGTLWLDQAVLTGSGASRFHGLPVRADIAGLLASGGIRFLRYGGTMVNAPEYRWKNMIGDPDRRPPYTGHWYPHSTNGFGIFDFLNFCEAAHIGSAFAINAEETDQDAADLADYLTAPATTFWGRKRAADGHPAPYDVRYIEIGNEEVIWGDNPADYAHYASRFAAIAKAIHGRNPRIKLVCAAWWRPESASMKTVFDGVKSQAAAWDLHVWSDDARSGVDVDRQIAQMQSLFHTWDPGSALKAVIFEENGNLHNMQRALGHATSLNAAMRHGDFVLADCPANCLQPLNQNENGWDQGQIFFTPGQAWGMPPYYSQQMNSAVLPLRVESRTDSPGNDLDVTATRSEDGKELVIQIANCGSSSHTAAIELPGFAPQFIVKAQTLSGPPDGVNTAGAPRHIASASSAAETLTAGSFAKTFPAYSYTVLRVNAGE